MEKRLILALVLSLLVLIFWQRLSGRKLPETHPADDRMKAVQSAGPMPKEASSALPSSPAGDLSTSLKVPEEPLFWLENTNLKLGVGQKTGVIRHALIKGYHEDLRRDSPMVDLSHMGQAMISSPVFAYATQNGFERLVPNEVTVHNDAGKAKLELTFEGLRAAYEILPQGYSFSVSIKKEGGYRLPAPIVMLWPFGTTKEEGKDRYHISSFQGLVGKKLSSIPLAKLKEAKDIQGPFPWVGFGDKFFFQALIDDSRPFLEVRLIPLNAHGFVMSVPLFDGAVQESALDRDLTCFMGPKAYDVLKAQGHDLVRVVDFGMFGFLGRPLLVTLKFFHRILGNWGLAIIAVTVLLKLLLAPLTHQSYQSMRKMTVLQPKIRALQERYKNDRTRLSQETMALYKAHKVNPLGGCLPTLIQIPVFFAFYYTLINTVELRHAPFFWWIQDLSAKDPYLVTPLLMGASMIALQLLTPNQQNTNPTQQRMMLLMPIVFTFIFLSLPSGLVLYYLFSNILSIAHLLFFRQWQKNRPLLAQAS